MDSQDWKLWKHYSESIVKIHTENNVFTILANFAIFHINSLTSNRQLVCHENIFSMFCQYFQGFTWFTNCQKCQYGLS